MHFTLCNVDQRERERGSSTGLCLRHKRCCAPAPYFSSAFTAQSAVFFTFSAAPQFQRPSEDGIFENFDESILESPDIPPYSPYSGDFDIQLREDLMGDTCS
ncbi:hypothetical protein Taro_017141 [Colocasia esculenta]|uniref:Uncharacterized protein n=1 Tax=Colocasia esculenta TaxID=4460 RepID=A0A843UMS6_COLES|nr:hypothetical protein [Colocasia esculenta]